jgi:hypothetical protein
VGRPLRDPRPGEPRANLAPCLILPLAVQIDGAAFKSSAPDLEATRRRSVRPRVFPLGGLRIEGAETEALDHRSLIRSLEKFQGNAAIQDLACREGKAYCVDYAIAELEKKLDPKKFVRIHRSTVVNVDWIKEVASLPGGALNVRLKDGKGTDLVVARDRAREFKERVGC